jgi:hypothetical protein
MKIIKKSTADTIDCKNKVNKQILKLPLIFEKILLKKEIKKKQVKKNKL